MQTDSLNVMFQPQNKIALALDRRCNFSLFQMNLLSFLLSRITRERRLSSQMEVLSEGGEEVLSEAPPMKLKVL